MKVCTYGLGAVGGLVAGRLARAGVEVCAVARGRTLDAVRSEGLTLVEQRDGGASLERSTVPVRAAESPAELGPQDVVIVAVKATALPAVAGAIAPLLTPDTAVVSAMNGIPWWFFSGLPGPAGGMQLRSLDPSGALRAGIPVENVVGCVLHLSASCPQPGTVRHGSGDRVIVGLPGGGPANGRLDRVAGILRRGGFEVELSERIQKDIWYKLWGNMTMNPLSALTGATLDRLLDDDLVRQFATRCMREAAEVGGRIGLPIDSDPGERHAVTRRLGVGVRTSMLQDVEAGRSVELDVLVTAVKELADRVGVPTPNIDTLLGLARLHARVRGLYPQEAVPA